MGIGIGIFLIALGAILTFAVDWSIGGLDLQAVGWILMVVGVGGLILFFYFWNQRRSPEPVSAVRQRQVSPQPRTYDDPTPLPPSTTELPPAPVQVTVQAPQPQAPVAVIATAPVVASSQARRDGG